MNKLNLNLILSASALVLSANIATAADTGSCGTNCVYNYDPATQTLTYTGTGPNGSGIINRTSISYGLSGTVKNAIINEGITEVIYTDDQHHNIIRDMGTPDGKLVIPSTVKSFSDDAGANLKFGIVEINSKDITFGYTSLGAGGNAQIIVSADANISFDDDAFYWKWANNLSLPTSLNIACKGTPDVCRSKFGNALDRMDQSQITADYYEERDENGNLTLKYNDNGYEKYDENGNVIERWNLENTEKYDNQGNILAKYDLKGNLLKSWVYNSDGSTFTYDAEGNLKTIRGKKIYTVEEAEAVTAHGDKFHVSLTYK